MIHPKGNEILDTIEWAFIPPSEYNQRLFSLYLMYLRRYKINYGHIIQARRVAALLQEKPWPSFTSWQQIIHQSKELKLRPKSQPGLGCPILKIGYMLQEIGAIGPKADEKGHWISHRLNVFDSKTKDVLCQFINAMKKSNRADRTLQFYLVALGHLEKWLRATNSAHSILTVNQKMIGAHLVDFYKTHDNTHYHYIHCFNLKKFYAWCVSEKVILFDPCSDLILTRPAVQITICSEEQLQGVCRFIRNPKSDPTHALVLTLALFFGFTQQDLLFATIQSDENSLSIILERKQKSFHRAHYYRDQTLTLPKEPGWLLELQKRFLSQWKILYDKTIKTYPRYSLILPRNGYYNRPVSRAWILEHVRIATTKATGAYIPLSVLRKTCGHLYSQNGEASTLSRLGWSRHFSFYYTWLPRRYYKSKK